MINPKEALQHKMTGEWHSVIEKYTKLSNYKKALDIGTACGLSCWTVAQNGNGFIKSVDIKHSREARRLSHEYEYNDRSEFIVCDSVDFFKDNNEIFDLIIIDGDHTRKGCYKDVVNAWEVLNVGGYMVCDDYLHPRLVEDVGWAIDKFAKERGLKIIIEKNKAIFQK